MPKRKSNVKKKPKQKSKSKTRTLSKKSGFKKSTKIIIGIVCVLAVVGIIVGVLVSKGIISSNNNNPPANTPANIPDVSNALPNTSLMTLDTQLINDGKENFGGDNKLLNNYIQRFILIISKKLVTDLYVNIKIIEKTIVDRHMLDSNFDLVGGDTEIIISDKNNDEVNIKDTEEYNMFYKYNQIIREIFGDNIDSDSLVKYLYIFGKVTIDQIKKFRNKTLNPFEEYSDYIPETYCKRDSNINCDNHEINFINLDIMSRNIYNNTTIIMNNLVEELMNIKKITFSKFDTDGK